MNRDELNILLESYQKDADCYASDIVGLENYSEDELCEIVDAYCEDIIDENELDVDVIYGEFIYGSRKRGTARPESDLDVNVYYVGDADEKLLKALFNGKDGVCLRIEGIMVDINPKKVSDDEEIRNKQISQWQRFEEENDREILNSF